MKDVLIHVGRSKKDGAKVGSGRYPLGSGERPYQGENSKFDKFKKFVKKANKKSIHTKKGSENISPASATLREVENVSRLGSRIAGRNSRNQKKDYSSMSDQELRESINRMRLEQDYEYLISNRNSVKTGKETLMEILDTAGDVAAIGVSVATILSIVHEFNNSK